MTSFENKFYTYCISFRQKSLLSCTVSCTFCFSQPASSHSYFEMRVSYGSHEDLLQYVLHHLSWETCLSRSLFLLSSFIMSFTFVFQYLLFSLQKLSCWHFKERLHSKKVTNGAFLSLSHAPREKTVVCGTFSERFSFRKTYSIHCWFQNKKRNLEHKLPWPF